MSFRLTVQALMAVAVLACIAVFALNNVRAQESGSAAETNGADADRGRDLSYTCYGCHGVESYKNIYPTYSVPKLEGQHPEYLVIALQAYASGERAHTTMHAQAASMSEQDMRDIAAFLAAEVIEPQSSPTPVGAAPAAAQTCVACHGTDGVGLMGIYPTLSGQHEDYLARSLLDYRNGMRKNAIMAGFVGQLSDQDIAELSAYYARQRPALSTARHANWFKAH